MGAAKMPGDREGEGLGEDRARRPSESALQVRVDRMERPESESTQTRAVGEERKRQRAG